MGCEFACQRLDRSRRDQGDAFPRNLGRIGMQDMSGHGHTRNAAGVATANAMACGQHDARADDGGRTAFPCRRCKDERGGPKIGVEH